MSESQFFAADGATGSVALGGQCSCAACRGVSGTENDETTTAADVETMLADLAERIADLKERVDRLGPSDMGGTDADGNTAVHTSAREDYGPIVARLNSTDTSDGGEEIAGTPPTASTRSGDGYQSLLDRLNGGD